METRAKKKTLPIILASLLCAALAIFGLSNLSVFTSNRVKKADAQIANYTTIELVYGANVDESDVAAAKAVYDGVEYTTNKAANEAYMALFGVTWDKGYLDVTDTSAPLYKYASVSGSVTEVKFYVHGEMSGFTSLTSAGNQVDCEIGGNHQIFRTSYSVIGVSDEDGNKAKITDGNLRAYVAGGYDSMFTYSGTFTIENIEFANTASTTVGASAAAADSSAKKVTSAEMVIKNCIFRGRLYVYDNFANENMTYIIENNVFDGSNYSGDSNAYPIFAQCRGGNNLIIKGNKISGFARGINIDNANVHAEISGNEISITDSGRSCIQLSSLASANITENVLDLTGGNAITLHNKLLTMSSVPEISVTGNTVNGNGYFLYDDAKASGKEFTKANLAFECDNNTVASEVDTSKGIKGSEVYENEGYVNNVVNDLYAFSVNGSDEFVTLQEAIDAAADNDVITVLQNTTVGGKIIFPEGKTLTLNLNGKTVTALGDARGIWANVEGTVTFTGSGYLGDETHKAVGYLVYLVGSLTIDGDATYESGLTVVQVSAAGANLVINGGNHIGDAYDGKYWTVNIIDSIREDVTVAINGGSFYNFDPRNCKTEGDGTNFLAPEAGVDYAADGENSSFTVKPNMAVQIVDADGNSVKAYATLKEAVAAGKDGEVLKLLKNIDLNEQIELSKGITIDGDGKYEIKATKQIVGTSGKSGMFYRVTYANDETLTFKNVTLNGNNLSKIFLNEGGKGETVFDGVTSKNGGGIAYGAGIHISGGGSHATVKNSTLTGSAGTMELNDTNYYAANDLWVGGNVDVVVENSTIGTVFVNSTSTLTARHGHLVIQGENTHIDYLSGEYEGGADKEGNLSSVTTITDGYVGTIFDKGTYVISGGTFGTEIKSEWCADGFIPKANGNGTYGVKEGAYVARINGVGYETVKEAINAANAGETVVLIGNVTENIEVAAGKDITLDLNGYTLSGGTAAGKAAILNNGTIVITDSSAAKSGTIKREDNGAVGETSYYVIDNRGTMTIENAIVTNNSGYRKDNPSGTMVGSSLIRNMGGDSYNAVLNIKGGKLSQKNFIAVKNDSSSILNVTGGEITSDHSAIQNWCNATITGGTIKGQLWTDAYDATSTGHTVIGGEANFSGEIVMDITGSIKSEFEVTGGTLDVSNWRITSACATAGGKPSVSGGTFTSEVPEEYCADGFIPKANDDGTYGVKEGAYVARINGVGYETLKEAINAANDGDVIILIKDVEADEVLTVNKAITIDLNGKTLTNNAVTSAYTLVTNAAVTLENGTYKSTNSGARAIGANANLTLSGVTVESAGLVGVAFSGNGGVYTVENSTLKGGYAIASFADNSTINITDSVIEGSVCGIYHNGLYKNLTLNVKDSSIIGGSEEVSESNYDVTGVYISGQSGNGYHNVKFEGSTVKGGTAVEVKYTNITVIDCEITATSSKVEYVQNSNGATTHGFALVSTDNAKGSETPAPSGTIKISGNSKFSGIVGLGNSSAVKEAYADLTDANYEISGGTFSSAIGDDYCVNGYKVEKDSDGTYKAAGAIEVWTGFSASNKVSSFVSIDEAMAYVLTLGEGVTRRVVVTGKYVLSSDVTIAANTYLDVLGTLTVEEGVTINVAADSKRFGVWAGAKVINNGTIIILGEECKVMVQSGSEFEGNEVSVPEGWWRYINGNSYMAIEIATAGVKVEYKDGTIGYYNKNVTLKNAVKVTLQRDFDGTLNFSGTSSDPYDVVIDLNGHTISRNTTSKGVAVIAVYNGKFVIKNGTVKSLSTLDENSNSALNIYSGAEVIVESDVVLDGGTKQPAVYLQGGSLTLYGTAKTEGTLAITTQGLNEHETLITIKDGATVTASNGIAIYNPRGELVIEGGNITGKTGVQICSGKLTISGGTITATGADESAGCTNAVFDGAAVSILNRNYPGGIPSVTITGGTFKSETEAAIRAYDWTNNVKADWSEAKDHVNVSGGIFSSIPENMLDLCKDEFAPVRNSDGTYTVNAIEYVAKIGDKKYETLGEAIEAAVSGDTVTLIADITIDGPSGFDFNFAGDLTIDLNGHSIDGTSVNVNYLNCAALGLNFTEYSDTETTVSIINGSATESKITAAIPVKVVSAYSADLKLVIGENVKLEVIGNGNSVVLDTKVYMENTDKNAAYFKNGGFRSTKNGVTRIYDQLSSAVNYGEAVMMNDYTTVNNVNVRSSWGNPVLDLGGKTYTFTGSGNAFELRDDGANITIKNGKIVSSGTCAIALTKNNQTLTLIGVEIEANGDYGIVTNGSYVNENITIENSKITAENGMGVYFPSTGSLTIVDSEITGKVGVQICAGSLSISGSETVITGNGTAESAEASGAIVDGSAVSIISRSGYGALVSVGISGGKFVSEHGTALKAYALDGTTESAFDNTAKVIKVSGGTFSSAIEKNYCADGYILAPNGDGTYVVRAGEYVARIGEETYISLEDALKAAVSGDTVVLLADITTSGTKGIEVKVKGGITLDLNGHSIDGTSVSAKNSALKLTATESVDSSIAIVNNAATESVITGILPVKITNGNYDLKLIVGANVKLNVIGSGNAVYLDKHVYMDNTDANAAYFKEGGFKATKDGVTRIYERLSSAVNYGEAVMMNDYTTGSYLNIWSSWGTPVLDLGGKTYTYTGKSNAFDLYDDGANITIKNGKIVTSGDCAIALTGSNQTLTLIGVEIEANGDYGIVTNGSYVNENITIENSKITVGNGVGVYFPSTGSLTIVDSEITGKVGVQICAGSLSISGSETVITGNGTAEAAEASGSVIDGSAVSIISRNGYGALVSVSISGGKFVSEHGTALKAYALDGTTESAFDNTDKVIVITGGKYNAIPEYMSDLCASGYRPAITKEGVYEIVEKQLAVSATLGEDISLNYYVKKKTDNTKVTVKYVKNGETVEEVLTEFVATTGKYAGRFVFRGITPQMLDRGITVMYEDGETKDAIENYSVADYLVKVAVNTVNTEKARRLASDTLYYGIAAMKYVGTETLTANAEALQARVTELGITQSVVEMVDTSVSEVTEKIVGVTVMFDNKNSLVFRVKNEVYEEKLGYRYYLSSKKFTKWDVTTVPGYHAYISEPIKATGIIGNKITFEVTDGLNFVQKVSYDIASYCAKIYTTSSASEQLKELAKATYCYGYSAQQYANA